MLNAKTQSDFLQLLQVNLFSFSSNLDSFCASFMFHIPGGGGGFGGGGGNGGGGKYNCVHF